MLFLSPAPHCDGWCDKSNTNLTLKPDPSYFGGGATVTAGLNDSKHTNQLLYQFCYSLDLPINLKELGCVGSNLTTASLSFTWNVTGEVFLIATVYNIVLKDNQIEYKKVGCIIKSGVDVYGKYIF